MKKFTLFLSAVAVLGLSGLSAHAGAPDGYTAIVVNGVGLLQTNDPDVNHPIEKVKVDNDYVLYAIDQEFGTTYAKVDGGSGNQLLINTIFDGTFYVADKDGNVFGPYSEDTNSYALYFYLENGISTIKGSHATSLANGRLIYTSGGDDVEIKLAGAVTIKDTEAGNESFKMSNIIGNVNADGIEGVATGNIHGSGKDNSGFED